MKVKAIFLFVKSRMVHIESVFFTLLLISTLFLQQCNKEEDNNSEFTAVKSLEPGTGGSISVVNNRGDSIILTLASWVISEETEITLKALDEPPANPFANNIFPGVSIEPDHLMLIKPAKLRIVFATPISDTSAATLFFAKQADLAFPIANQAVTENVIEGEIYHFSDYSGSTPSGDEASDQIDKLMDFEISDLYHWQELYVYIYAAYDYIELFNYLGRYDDAERLKEELEETVEKVATDFLNLPVPEDPCGDYQKAFFKYDAAVRMIVSNEQLHQQYQDKGGEILNHCYIKGEIEYDYDLFYSMTESGVTTSFQFTVDGVIPFYVNTWAEPVGDIHGQGILDYIRSGETTGEGITCTYAASSPLTSTISGVMALDDFGTAWLEINIDDVFPEINTVLICPQVTIPYKLEGMNWTHNIRALPDEQGYEVIVPETTGGTYKWIISVHIQQ